MGAMPVAGTPPATKGAVSVLSATELAVLQSALLDHQAQRLEQRRLLGSGQDLLDPVVAAQASSLDELVKEVDAALRRIEDGTYGVCRHCGATIPFERLELVPHASGCVRCLSARQGR